MMSMPVAIKRRNHPISPNKPARNTYNSSWRKSNENKMVKNSRHLETVGNKTNDGRTHRRLFIREFRRN